MFFGNLRIFPSDYFPLKAITICGQSVLNFSNIIQSQISETPCHQCRRKKNHTRSVISGKHHKNCTTRKYWNCKRWKNPNCVSIFLLKWNAPTSGAICTTLRFISELILSYAVLLRFSRQNLSPFYSIFIPDWLHCASSRTVSRSVVCLRKLSSVLVLVPACTRL